MESLKIALVSDWFYPKVGGIEAHIHELAVNLLKRGHEPHVITHDYRKYDGSRIDDRIFPYKVYRFGDPIYIKRFHVSIGPRILAYINKLFKLEKYDVTHAHSIYSPLAVAVANISRRIRKTPVVATNHSLFDWERKLARIGLEPLRYWLKRVNVFITVSSIVYNDTIRIIRKKPGKGNSSNPYILLIPNAIDVDFWIPPEPGEYEKARERLGLDKDSLVVSVVGRFTKRKMIHRAPLIVCNAWRMLGGEKKVTLVIVGDGELRSRIEEEAEKYSRPPSYTIKLFGYMPREELRTLYWASDLVFVPSRYESFSIVALEAISSGSVVVGFSGSGIVDIVKHTGAGVVVDTPLEASKAIAELLLDSEKRAKMVAMGREKVREHFSWDVVIHKILDAYKLALDSQATSKA